jgi:very-short-patch-repair endonuclease
VGAVEESFDANPPRLRHPSEEGIFQLSFKMQRKILPYNPALKDLARNLRKNMTLAEVLLWNQIKKGQIQGFDFDRQHPILNYIVDFYCKDLMLAIEIDGSTHDFKIEKDEIRQRELESVGIRVLRFLDSDVKANLEGVVKSIEMWVEGNSEANV